MENEQTDKTDTEGKETDKPVEKPEEPISDFDKALKVVEKKAEVAKLEADNLTRKEKLAANAILAGNAGGHVEAKTEDPASKLADDMVNAFK